MKKISEENGETEIRNLPNRRLTEVEKEYIFLETERLKLRREGSLLILNKGVFLFLTALAVGMYAVTNRLITSKILNILIIVGLTVLIVSILPYQASVSKEEKRIEKMIDDLMG